MAERITVYVCSQPDRPNLVLQYVEPDTGRRKSKSAKTADPDAAERARADWEYELNHGLASDPCKMPWEDFHQLYLEEKLADVREATRKKASSILDLFGELAHPKNLGAVNERMVSKYAVALRENGNKAATIAGHLAYLRAALRWAAGQKLIPAAPKINLPKLPKTSKLRKIVLEQFEKLLIKAPDALWRAFLATAWHSGMRRNEMLDLHWQGDADKPWVDFEAGRIRIPAAYNKSDADQWIPLHPDLAEVLRPLRKDRGKMFPLGSPTVVSRKFADMAKAAGLKITLHDLRRSFGSRYASVVTAPQLQRLMRHANIQTTLAFYTDIDDTLDEAIRKA